MRVLPFLILLLSSWSVNAREDRVTYEKFTHQGRTRTYSLYVPDTVTSNAPAPLLIALHGSGRDGRSIVNPWRELARKEQIVVVGPDSVDKALWDFKHEGPDFFQALVNAVRGKHSIDQRRMYVFGHSAGAVHGLRMGLLESEYFAAVAVHAGSLATEDADLLDNVDRKIPVGIWIGTADRFFSMEAVNATKDTLQAKGIPVHLRPIVKHDHNYYLRARDVNGEVWSFLREHKLEQDPKFKQYDVR